MLLRHFFPALEGQPLAFVLNPILIRQASPCVVLISLEQQQQFYTAPSYLYPTIPTLHAQGGLADPLFAESSPFLQSPPPHLAGNFSMSWRKHIHISTFLSAVAGASSR